MPSTNYIVDYYVILTRCQYIIALDIDLLFFVHNQLFVSLFPILLDYDLTQKIF